MSRNNRIERKKPDELLSVSKYISINEFDEKIISLLKITCKNSVMTKNEWDIKLEKLLSRKTI